MSAPKRGLPPKRRMRHDRHFVDELAQRMGEGIGRMIPITRITSNHDQPRSSLGDLRPLTESIRKHGILEPLLVRRESTSAGGYELVSGERRFHAALAAGLDEVPCVELDVSDQHALEIALIENLQRKDLGPFEEAEGFQTLIDKYEYTHQQVAVALGRSRVTVTETLQLLAIPPEIRDQCRHADITAKGVLLEISKAPNVSIMKTLLSRFVTEKLDRRQLRDLRHSLSDDPPERSEKTSHSTGQKGARSTRPFVVRYRHPDKRYSISLTFRTSEEPDRSEVIQVLEELLKNLRDEDTAESS